MTELPHPLKPVKLITHAHVSLHHIAETYLLGYTCVLKLSCSMGRQPAEIVLHSASANGRCCLDDGK